jgi:AcrR family transcriptional regulator
MSLLKEKIMDSAMRLFTEKGYMSTTMQDIANDCSIAKGSLYKFFASKEDLLIEVYDSHVQKIYDEAKAISEDQTLSSREKFIRETQHQLIVSEMTTNIDNSQGSFLTENEPINPNKFISFCHHLRIRWLNYYKSCLLDAYGPKLEPYVWDLVVMYQGIMKEYIQFQNLANQPLPAEKVAVFIVDRMDEMAAGMMHTNHSPILKSSIIMEYMQSDEGMSKTKTEQKEILFETLFDTVQELSVGKTRKTELIEATELLQEEAKKDHPKRILIRSLLEFLRSQHELKNSISQLDKFL